MDPANIPYKVHKCFKCLGDKEYYCESCPYDLCQKCKENHLKDLKTKDHYVVHYCYKFNCISNKETCVRHPSKAYSKYCEPCQVPVCDSCSDHKLRRFPSFLPRKRRHKILNIHEAYRTKRQQHRGIINTIRSEALFYRPVLLTRITDDIKACRTEFSLYRSEMSTKAQKLKNVIDYVQKDFTYNVFCHFDFNHRCLKEKMEMSRHIAQLQKYEHRYEQSAICPLQFLSTIKTALSQINLTLHTSQLSMTESLNKEDVMESLTGIQITKRGNQRVGKDCLLKMMPDTEFHQSLIITGVKGCYHISCVTLDWVWVSNKDNNLILTDTTGVTLHCVEDLCSDSYYTGSHTVNSEYELIYINRNYNINKLSKNMKTTTTFIEKTDSTWEPRCVYWSRSTGDLLVGMFRKKPKTDKVTRYNQSGQLTQTINNNNTGLELYSEPCYITENNNGDVVVSAIGSGSGLVVVTNLEGKHRFCYTGHASESTLQPSGICTDALSHIIVCNSRTNTVHMLDKDGQFLSHLLIRPPGIFSPWSLCYDINTHRLLVGSLFYNKIFVYRYIERHKVLPDLNPTTANSIESLSEISTKETEKPQQENQCILKLVSPPELIHNLKVRDMHRCYHISCMTSDRIWVSEWNNLIWTDTTGVTVHRVEDLGSGLYNGLHTVNCEGELIYIDSEYNINKISKDMEITTKFLTTTHSWKPICVYWSPSTGDLLVGMNAEKQKRGKVTRTNQSGQLTQIIQHNNTGLGLYNQPNYITENCSGDVVVSDYDYEDESGAVVVTGRRGRHLFSYTGHPSGSGLQPTGICTDALSHILVCDDRTKTVHMLNKDGQFLLHLLTESQEIGQPRSLSYDVSTHRLLVGSAINNTLYIYRYIDRQDTLTDEDRHRRDQDACIAQNQADNGDSLNIDRL